MTKKRSTPPPVEQTEAWQEITVPKPTAPRGRSLGRGTKEKDAQPITDAQVRVLARDARHGRCVDHVTVDGLRDPVCILRGQDAALVVAEALELGGPA